MYNYFISERPKILNLGSGSIFKNLKSDYIKSLKLVLPDQLILCKANEKFMNLSEKIYINTLENKKLTELRVWLLPMLMNGQVKVE